jgi:predicted phage tail protein
VNLVPVDSAVRFGEIIPPGASVRVIGTTHALNAVSGARIDRYLQTGLTIRQMLEEALDERADILSRCSFVVSIDGNPIEERNWHRVRAKAGTVVTFIPRLQGGGDSSILRAVLSVVIAVAATLVAGPLAGQLTIAGFALTTATASIATAMIAGGIVPAGPVALDALFQWACEISPSSLKLLLSKT